MAVEVVVVVVDAINLLNNVLNHLVNQVYLSCYSIKNIFISGYTCGQYGCAKIRAHSALTHKDGFLITDEEFDKLAKPKNNIFGVARQPQGIKKINETEYLKLTVRILDF